MWHLESILLVTSFILPFVLGASMLFNTKGNVQRYVMVCALFNTSLVFLFNYLYFQKEYGVYSYVHSVHIASVLWIFPGIYFYLKSIIDNCLKINILFWNLLPGLFMMTVSAFLFYGLLSSGERIYYLENYRNDNVHFNDLRLQAVYVFRFFDVVLIIGQIVYYSIKIIRTTNSFNEKLMIEFGNIEKFSVRWIKIFTFLFLIVGILCICFYIFNPFAEKNKLFLVLVLFLVSMFVWLMGLVSLNQQKVDVELDIKESDSSILLLRSVINDDCLAKKLEEFMENSKAYIDSEISLTIVSRNLGTNRSYLSALINQQYGMNFNAFVNQYRVKYITEYLLNNPNVSKADVYQMAGFGSLTTLNRSLKKIKTN